MATRPSKLGIGDLQLPQNDVAVLKRHFGLSTSDEGLIAKLKSLPPEFSESLLTAFYEHLLSQPHTKNSLRIQTYFNEPGSSNRRTSKIFSGACMTPNMLKIGLR